MMLRDYARKVKHRAEFAVFSLTSGSRQKFECPVCAYSGPFMDVAPPTGLRQHAKCPSCHSLERHRLQFVVVEQVLRGLDTQHLKMIHFAPEPFFRAYFSERFTHYESADLCMKDVDHNVDLQGLPFEDASYDFVFASHVLEHIPDDRKAVSEIRRILRPGGIAILPVPIVSEKTIEYPEPNPHEAYHVRAPGFDYFERYEQHFSRVERFTSESLPEKYQLFVLEDRSQWPTKECPLRPAMAGSRHIDIVPICWA